MDFWEIRVEGERTKGTSAKDWIQKERASCKKDDGLKWKIRNEESREAYGEIQGCKELDGVGKGEG